MTTTVPLFFFLLSFTSSIRRRQTELKLIRMRDGFKRSTDPSYGIGFHPSFSDGFPMLLATEESLEEVNARLLPDEKIGMDRFRPK